MYRALQVYFKAWHFNDLAIGLMLSEEMQVDDIDMFHNWIESKLPTAQPVD